jgi:hypothetical protein
MDDDFIPMLLFTVVGGFILFAITKAVVRAPGASLQRKFQKLGTIKGQHIATIIAAVGQPNSRSVSGDGRVVCQWISSGYHIALIFTDNICDGITHEFAA